MPELRFRFVKEGRAAYLSHLDLMRTFQRAFLRAGWRVKHSEGFNPHPRMSIVLPLQLGCESGCEALDVSFIELPENSASALNRVLPEGIRVTEVYSPVLPGRDIRWTEWTLRFHSKADAQAAEAVLRSPSLPVEKKTKRGVGILDIAPHITILRQEDERLSVRLKAVEPTVNCGDLQRALSAFLPEQAAFRARRTGLKTADLKEFR